jgi:hypothetical protein
LGLPPSSSITDAAATVLTHITSFALTENGRFPFPSSLSIDAACSGAAFMSACLTPVSVRAKEAGAVIESKEALSTAGHGVFHAYPLADRVEIIVEGTKLYKWIVSEAFSRPNVKEWLDSVYTLVQFYVQTGERKWAVVVGQAIRVDRSRSRLKPTCSQRTRLLGIRSGRSLRSLGSPLNARPLGGHDESIRRVRKA